MKRVLVTGAGGFIGRSLCRIAAQRSDYDVFATDRRFDLRSPDAVRSLLTEHGQFDYIVHAADVGGDAAWAETHSGEQFSNATMAVNLLAGWREHQAQARFVGLSTLWAYPEAVVDVDERAYWSGRMHVPTEHYGAIKKLLGIGISACRRQWGVRGTMLVLGNVYGPGDVSSRVIPSLIKRMREHPDTLEVWGDGEQTRDFVYIDDQVEGILTHLDFDGELLNITTGVYVTLKELVDTLVRLVGYNGKVVFGSNKSLGVDQRRVSVELARSISGWPSCARLHSLEAGLSLTLAGELSERVDGIR